jgi:hypothetical protein
MGSARLYRWTLLNASVSPQGDSGTSPTESQKGAAMNREAIAAKPWALKAAQEIFSLFKNASYFSTRNAEHRAQMLEGWAQIIERNAADEAKQEQR